MTPSPPSPPETATRRRRVTGLVAIVVAALVVGGWYYGFGPGADLRVAEAALARHDPAAARPYLDRRLKIWPSDQRTLFLAARAARRTDAYADAERLLARYEAEHGTTEEYRLEWALLGIQQGDTTGDANRIPPYVDLKHPDAMLVQEAVAKGTQAEFRLAEAAKMLAVLVEKVPDYGPAYLRRGQLLDALHQGPDVAQKDFRRAVELLPQDVDARLGLADHLVRKGYTREGIAHFEWVLQTRPGDPAALLGLARAHADQADPAAAVARLDELLLAHPDYVEGLTDRGRLALRANRPAEAEPFFERATKAAPWHRDATRLLLSAQAEQGKSDAAARTAARVAELIAEDGLEGKLKLRAKDNAADVAVRWELFLWAGRNGQDADGRAWLFEILHVQPNHAGARRALAEYFERVNQPKRAAAHRAAAKP